MEGKGKEEQKEQKQQIEELRAVKISEIKRNQSQIRFVLPREQLIEIERQNDRKKKLNRRTKILATLGKKTINYESIFKMVKSGVNGLVLNLAYATKEQVVEVKKIRDKIEQETDSMIPLNCVLQGTLIRIGDLWQPEVFLKKGQLYRIVLGKGIVGDENICSIESDTDFNVDINDKILVDYGQVSLSIIGFEKSEESLIKLQEKFYYGNDFERLNDGEAKFKDSLRLKISSLTNIDIQGIKSADDRKKSIRSHLDFNSAKVLPLQNTIKEEYDFSQSKQNQQEEEEQQEQQQQQKQSIQVEENNPFASNIMKEKKKKKIKSYKVIVCQIDGDCQLKPFKPIFCYNKNKSMKRLSSSGTLNQNNDFQNEQLVQKQQQEEEKLNQKVQGDSVQENSDQEEDILTPKDIIDISTCKDNSIYSITISNIKSAQDVLTLKEILSESEVSHFKFIFKVQTPEAVINFNEIIKLVDGVLIARGYLMVHFPVEKLIFQITKMIKKCHELMKLCLVSCNILESMISSPLPTIPELGEISNLVSEYVDGIVLSGETAYGDYPIQAIETLSRICQENEALQVQKLRENPTLRNSVFIDSNNPKHKITNTIIYSIIETSYKMPCQLIITFTISGATALKLSKLRPPCPVVALSDNKIMSRLLNLLSGVKSFYVPSFRGQESIILKIIAKLKADAFIHKGDFVIIALGDENNYSYTNVMKILEVE